MSLRHPSTVTRRLLKVASLGLAGLVVGLLSGCSATTAAPLHAHNDTDWQTFSTYASATSASFSATGGSVHISHAHACVAGPCEVRIASTHPSRHHAL